MQSSLAAPAAWRSSPAAAQMPTPPCRSALHAASGSFSCDCAPCAQRFCFLPPPPPPPPPLLRAPCGMLCLPRWLAARSAWPPRFGETAVPRLPDGAGFLAAGRCAGWAAGRLTCCGLAAGLLWPAVDRAFARLRHFARGRLRLLHVTGCRGRLAGAGRPGTTGLGARVAALHLRRRLWHLATTGLAGGRLRIAGLGIRDPLLRAHLVAVLGPGVAALAFPVRARWHRATDA